MATPKVTPAERAEWVGREVEMTYGQAPKLRTVRYKVLDVTRFGPDGELKLQIGSLNAAGLGVIGTFAGVSQVRVVE